MAQNPDRFTSRSPSRYTAAARMSFMASLLNRLLGAAINVSKIWCLPVNASSLAIPIYPID
jgi:hypothetical protein